MKHYNITVSGRVQGVGFRYNTQKAARNLGLKGFVKNMPDGSVYIEAEGDDEAAQSFIDWCKKGPDRARVYHTFITEGNIQGFNDFETRY